MSIVEILSVAFLLLAGHAVADYALQSDFIAQAKNHTTEIGRALWIHVLPAHALIHGLAVMLATGIVWLAIAETVIHGVTDYAKSDGRITLGQDQSIHYACKLAWLIIYCVVHI